MLISLEKYCGANLPQIVAVRAQMIVDHVQNHAQAQRVRAIDEAAKVVGRAVQMCVGANHCTPS